MLKLRLKRIGRKRAPFYRLIIMEHSTRRDGKAIDEIGWYNPITKAFCFNYRKTQKWLGFGVKPTRRAWLLLKQAELID